MSSIWFDSKATAAAPVVAVVGPVFPPCNAIDYTAVWVSGSGLSSSINADAYTAQMKRFTRKGRKPAEPQPVDKVSVRVLVSSEDTTQSSYAWGSQEDPYSLGLDDAPFLPFDSQVSEGQHPEHDGSGSLQGYDSQTRGGDLQTAVTAPSRGIKAAQKPARDSRETLSTVEPAYRPLPSTAAAGKRKAPKQRDSGKAKLTQGCQVLLQLGRLLQDSQSKCCLSYMASIV